MTTDAFQWRAEDNLGPMHPRVNTQVRAADRAEALVMKVWPEAGKVARVLFDPELVPDMAKRADDAAAEFHRRAGKNGDLHARTHDTEYEQHALYEQGALRVWPVGTNHVDVIRDRWHDPLNRNRIHKPVDYFAGMYGCQLSDFFDCGGYGCDGNCGRACSVRLAKACRGPTGILPVGRGTLVMLCRCCRECEALAGDIAADKYKASAERERAELPPGAVILPDPDPGVNPDAWA